MNSKKRLIYNDDFQVMTSSFVPLNEPNKGSKKIEWVLTLSDCFNIYNSNTVYYFINY